MANGCYDKSSIILTVAEKENKQIVYDLAKKYNLSVKMHSDSFSLMINSSNLKFIFREVLELIGDSHTKRIPQWVFNISKEQQAYILKGIFSGDGSIGKHEITLNICSIKQTALEGT